MSIHSSYHLSNLSLSDTFRELYIEKKFLNEYSKPFIANNGQSQKEIVIQSDKQSEVNDIIYAEGNVIVQYQGKVLKADSLIYEKPIKKISAKGNISLIVGNQILKSSELEYSFTDEKGYLINVKGFINSRSLIKLIPR